MNNLVANHADENHPATVGSILAGVLTDVAKDGDISAREAIVLVKLLERICEDAGMGSLTDRWLEGGVISNQPKLVHQQDDELQELLRQQAELAEKVERQRVLSQDIVCAVNVVVPTANCFSSQECFQGLDIATCDENPLEKVLQTCAMDIEDEFAARTTGANTLEWFAKLVQGLRQ